MVDSPFNSAMIRMLAARPADEFIGRKGELERLAALAEEAASGAEHAVALEAPPGGGKSELLRQLTLSLSVNSGVCLPIYLDLPAFFTSGPYAALSGEHRMREALFRAFLRQALLGTGSLEPGDVPWLESDPSRLAGFCYGAGLGVLAPFAGEAACHLSFAEAWRALLGAWRGQGLPPLVLLLDGAAASPDPVVTAALGLILESARREGCPVFFEAPVESEEAVPPAVREAERFVLRPLQPADALHLTQRIGAARGWTLPAPSLEPVLARLGPWPGWVRGWAMKVHGGPGINPVRLAEEAYVDFLGAGTWAEGLRRRFERLIPLTAREQALRLLRTVLERQQVVSAYEAPAMLGLGEPESARVLDGLTRLGLLSRRGSRWGAPAVTALADWSALLIAEDARDADPTAVRLNLLNRLLTLPRPAPEATAARPRVGQVLPDILRRFRGQVLPPVLFHFADYYEAVGRLDPERRREAVQRATATLRLPEVIGVAAWPPTPLGDRHPVILYARAYREGKYQRSHEEVWIAVDLSAVRMLTTPEITAALQKVEALETRLGPNRFHRWLILGEGASAEALEMIRGQGYYCSGREQLALIQEWLMLAQPAAESESKAVPADPPQEASRPQRHTVIDLKGPDAEPRAEVSSLRLPAREGSELIAALAAEKIALRSDFDPAQAGQIKTAVLEGVLNAIEHSLNAEKSIDIQFILNPETLEVVIENEGPGFDPLAVPTPDPQAKLTAAHKRGWGLSLMRRFMDEIGYEPCERGTRLRLVKRRRRPRAMAVEESVRGKL